MSKRKHYIFDKEGFDTVKDMGFEVRQYSEYHYRIFKAGHEYGDLCLDVWPTAHKYCRRKGDSCSKSRPYDNIVILVEDELDTFRK